MGETKPTKIAGLNHPVQKTTTPLQNTMGCNVDVTVRKEANTDDEKHGFTSHIAGFI